MTNFVGKNVDRVTIFNLILIITLFSLPFVTAALTKNSSISIPASGTIGAIATRPLHVEGRYIKDDLGNIIYLRGVGHFRYVLDPTGMWASEGGAWYDGQYRWDETAVRYHMQTLREWGVNHIRFHTTADWWIDDVVSLGGWTGSYRYNLKRTIEIAAEEGIYVIFDLYTIINADYQLSTWGFNNPSGPFPPYFNWYNDNPDAEALVRSYINNKSDFVDYWASVANELKVYDNVIFELFNEPHAAFANEIGVDTATARDDWFDGVQKAIDAIRATGAQNLILVGWGLSTLPYYGWEGPSNVDMGWVEAYPLNDPLGNIFYTAHMYRTYYVPLWHDSYDYNDCYTKMVDTLYKYVVENLSKPVIIGEIGVNMWDQDVDTDGNGITELDEDLMWAANVFNISNQWGMGYSAWSWEVVDQWHLLAQDAGPMLPPPSRWGQVLIDAVAAGGTIEFV